jgi:hypothetical protein
MHHGTGSSLGKEDNRYDYVACAIAYMNELEKSDIFIYSKFPWLSRKHNCQIATGGVDVLTFYKCVGYVCSDC